MPYYTTVCSLQSIKIFLSVSGVESLVDGLFNYARNLAALRMNDAQLALFCAVSLISCGE